MRDGGDQKTGARRQRREKDKNTIKKGRISLKVIEAHKETELQNEENERCGRMKRRINLFGQ